jgi:hypothetical protein
MDIKKNNYYCINSLNYFITRSLPEYLRRAPIPRSLEHVSHLTKNDLYYLLPLILFYVIVLVCTFQSIFILFSTDSSEKWRSYAKKYRDMYHYERRQNQSIKNNSHNSTTEKKSSCKKEAKFT